MLRQMLKFETAAAAMEENKLSRQRRVWVTCESCEGAPAAFLCKADSASLCAACDVHIHSANPLARRHLRVPIPAPLSDDDDDEDESASWLLLNPIKNGDVNEVARPSLFVDDYLDLDEFIEGYDNQQQQQQSYGVPHSCYGGDSIVPIQNRNEKNHEVQPHCFQLGYGYPSSMSQTVSIPSTDVGIVPESANEALIAHTRPSKGTIDLFSSPQIQAPSQLSPMDREARVMRYREKKKTRKFEKTIRYASRKAYAETRPRIKGRFAKRRSAQLVQVDEIFSSQFLMTDASYGVVPSF